MKMLDNLREKKKYEGSIDEFIEQQELRNLPEDSPDKIGSTMDEVNNNENYTNIRLALDE